MSDSLVEKLMLTVPTVLWVRASEFSEKTGHRMATGCSKPRDSEGSP
jgi:hypothetical protein